MEKIHWHYLAAGHPDKKKMIDWLKEAWGECIKPHLQPNLQKILSRPEKDGPLILILTMRNRLLLDIKWGELNCFFDKDEEMPYAMKQFLAHLKYQSTHPFERDAASEALLQSKDYVNEINYFNIFQIERVRRIRHTSRLDNNHIEICTKILRSLRVVEKDDEFGGIYVPSSAMKPCIDLQLALCSARTDRHKRTLKYTSSIRKQLASIDFSSFSLLKEVWVWWTWVIEERVYASCFEMDQARKRHDNANNVAKAMSVKFPHLKGYIETLRIKNSGLTKQSLEDGRIFREADSMMNYYHQALSVYINSKINPKNKFDKNKIAEIMSSSERLGTVFKLEPGHEGRLKEKRAGLNKTLHDAISGIEKGVTGAVSKTGKVPPLFYQTSLKDLETYHKRLGKIVSFAIGQTNIVLERKNRNAPLALILIGVDVLAKMTWLLQIWLNKTRKKSPEDAVLLQGFYNDVLPLIKQQLVIVFRNIKFGLEEIGGDSSISKWAESIFKVLKHNSEHTPNMGSEEQVDFTLRICETAIGWNPIKEISRKKFEDAVYALIVENKSKWGQENGIIDVEMLAKKLETSNALVKVHLNHLSTKFSHPGTEKAAPKLNLIEKAVIDKIRKNWKSDSGHKMYKFDENFRKDGFQLIVDPKKSQNKYFEKIDSKGNRKKDFAAALHAYFSQNIFCAQKPSVHAGKSFWRTEITDSDDLETSEFKFKLFLERWAQDETWQSNNRPRPLSRKTLKIPVPKLTHNTNKTPLSAREYELSWADRMEINSHILQNLTKELEKRVTNEMEMRGGESIEGNTGKSKNDVKDYKKRIEANKFASDSTLLKQISLHRSFLKSKRYGRLIKFEKVSNVGSIHLFCIDFKEGVDGRAIITPGEHFEFFAERKRKNEVGGVKTLFVETPYSISPGERHFSGN